jgi:hypothetical protein
MAWYESGSAVRSGYYLGIRAASVALVANDGDRLAGPAGARFVRVPWPAVLLLAPVLSIVFLLLLPAFGLGVMAYGVARRLARGGRRASAELAATVAPGWAPGEAHLSGKPGADGARPEGEARTPEELARLEREIAGRRDGAPKV